MFIVDDGVIDGNDNGKITLIMLGNNDNNGGNKMVIMMKKFAKFLTITMKSANRLTKT